MSEQPWYYRRQRQFAAGVAIIYFRNLRRGLNFFLAVVVVSLGGDRFSMLGMGMYAWATIMAMVLLVWSFLQYWRYFFYVQEGHFIVEQGVLSHQRVSVPFSRIQTVNTTQNPIQRLLRTVGIKVETAGSSVKEMEISALSLPRAEELQEFLLAQKEQHESDSETADDASREQAPAPRREEEALLAKTNEEPVLKLNLQDVLRIGLTANHLRNGFLLVVIVYGYLNQYQDYLMEPIEPYLEEVFQVVPHSSMVLIPLGILLFSILAVIASLVTYTLKFYGLRLYLNNRGLRMISGLLRRNEYRVLRPKIQYLKWKSNPLRALIGYRSLLIRQATSAQGSGQQSIEVPGLLSRALLKLIHELYPQRKQGIYYHYRAHVLLFRQLSIWYGIIPALLSSTYIAWLGDAWILLYLPGLWLTLVLLWAWPYYQTVKLRINREVVELRKGWIFPSTEVIPHYKLQNMSLHRSIFQRRLGLASLHFHTAAGSTSMPHIALEEAQWWYDFLLYRIERSEQSWM